MRIEGLIALVERTPGVSEWKLEERRVEGQQLFFVRRELDMQRVRSVRRLALTVYHDFEEEGRPFRGSVRIRVHPQATEAELSGWLQEAVFAARQVRNEPFPLVEPGGAAARFPSHRFGAGPLEEWLPALSEAVFAPELSGLPGPLGQGGSSSASTGINSAELFLDRVETRIRNSRGVDVGWSAYDAYVELITEAEGPAGAVELYKEIQLSDYLPERLTGEVRAQLELTGDRAQAEPTPQLKTARLILNGEPVREFLGYYLTQGSAESMYSEISRFKVGDGLQGRTVRGDCLSIGSEPYLEGSTASAPWDEDGFALQSTVLVEDGVLRRAWGPLRFCHYLGIPPTGRLANVEVRPGSRSLEAMREDAHLEVIAFSDFQSDPVTGDFGGEIRLGYLLEEGRRRPVTGGSISGNIRELQGELYLSRELQQLNGFRGPRALQLPGVAVAGVR
ncbi:MAG: hypothetical protein JW820_14025 [Spirochaetales bacterium]|nr:hypothetical protein [Spirochaetales bacterium]